ncbi:MAG: sulfite exporter TauE/SafE family protein [Pseudomonadota bacterium]
MDTSAIALATFGFAFAGFIKGLTGLGFSSTCLPFLVLALGLKTAIPLVLLPSLATNASVMIDAGHFRETLQRFWPMYLTTLAGLGVGLYFLVSLDEAGLVAILGLVLMAYGAYALAKPDLRLPSRLEQPLALPSGLLTGVINGCTGCQLVPSMPFLMALHMEPNRFLQAINISFSLSSVVVAAGLAKFGLLTWKILGFSLLSFIPVFLGIWVGSRLRKQLSVAAFRTAALSVMVLLGALLLLRPVF